MSSQLKPQRCGFDSLPSLPSCAVNRLQEQRFASHDLLQWLLKPKATLEPAGLWGSALRRRCLCWDQQVPGSCSASQGEAPAAARWRPCHSLRDLFFYRLPPGLWKAPDHHRQLCCLPDLMWSFTQGFWFSLSLCLHLLCWNLTRTFSSLCLLRCM